MLAGDVHSASFQSRTDVRSVICSLADYEHRHEDHEACTCYDFMKFMIVSAVTVYEIAVNTSNTESSAIRLRYLLCRHRRCRKA